ncbi:class I SAM-dependent methyltransferase [Pseudomonas sp. GOM7]|uniref:N5-glutamine methyltransferase family protein n=1 Tax=Pseudomonas sp. GOM7 TaxID=2998079 RepID=UPI00227A29D0|nr:class I SAM-dependent methyltransferase [Pseudomonas sp. GOM7]WAJ39853.1 class I SAM-dependent methyltransferase [Pseudomonas sp. GOM7]
MHESGLTPTCERDIALLQLGSLLRARGYHFITPTPLTHERVNARADAALAGDLRDVFGWNRPFSLELLDEPIMTAMRGAEVLQPCGDLWRSRVRWSSLDEQLYLHAGFPTEQADAVFFGPDTYRFVRLLKAHLAHERRPIRRIADIGCGSGAGAICTALARPQAEVLALDINPEALAFTTVNARLAGLFNLQARHSDLLRDVDGQFDLIIANPPYMLDPLRRTYRHGGGRHGSALSLAIFDTAMERLAPGGTLLLYSGVAIVKGEDALFNAIALSLRDTGWDWQYEEIDPDVFGEELQNQAYAEVERIACVALRLTCRQ